MFCTNCGKELNEGVTVCPYCGEHTDDLDAQSAAPSETADAPFGVYTAEGTQPAQTDAAEYGEQQSSDTLTDTQNVPQKKPVNGIAVAGLILSVLFAPLGLVLSIIGLVRSKKMDGEGRKLGIAGIVISVLVIVCVIVFIVLYVVLFIEIFQAVVDGINQELNDPDTYAAISAMMSMIF